MSDLHSLRKQARQKQISDADAALRLPRPRQRLDGGLGLLALGAVVSFTGLGWFVASALDVSGLLDPPLLAEVDDRRILTDYRATSAPMVDMIALGDALLIGRQTGAIDRYDTRDQRFATESLPAELASGLALLSQDCPQTGCGTGAAAYALSAAGGLAERSGTSWDVVLGEGAFIGADGQPVEQDDVRGWAVSQNGRTVLIDAGAQGLGLFDQTSGRWRSGPAMADVSAGPLYHEGAFYIGSSRGLHQIVTQNGAPDWGAAPLRGTEGAILSVSAGAPGAPALVLRQSSCADGGTGCLSLLALERGGSVRPLMQELASLPDLNDSGLKHIVRQGDALITIGRSGIHTYDAGRRSWQLIDPAEPTAWFAGADGATLLAALPARVLTFRDGKIAGEAGLEEPLVQLIAADYTDSFGLDRRGRILALTPQSAKVISAADAGGPPGATYTAAVGLDPLFVALGPQGILIHDTAFRRYSFVPAQSLPPVPLENNILVAGQGDQIWLVGRSDGKVQSLKIEGDFPQKSVTATFHGQAGMSVSKAHADGSSVVLIGAKGGVARLMADGTFSAPVGDPLIASLRPVTVLHRAGEYVFSSGDDIWVYDEGQRGWSGPFAGLADQSITDLAATADTLLALGDKGQALAIGRDDWDYVSGGPGVAGFDSQALQDALSDGSSVYFAARNQVQSYSPGLRSFGDSWRGAGDDAQLLAVRRNLPVWVTSAGVYHGSTLIEGGLGYSDGWLGASGVVGLYERPTGPSPNYLKSGGECLYLGGQPPAGEILDVAQLDAGRLLVRTTSQLGLYQPQLHRWLPALLDGLTRESRLMVLGAHLVMLNPDGIASVPLAQIPLPESCATGPVRIRWQLALQGRHASLVDGADEVLLLEKDGSLVRWQEGAALQIRPPGGDGPRLSEVMRAYDIDGQLFTLTARALWVYAPQSRVWRSWKFERAPAQVSQIDLSKTGDEVVLTIWDAAGAPYSAASDLQARAITFAPVSRPALPVIPVNPADIRDMAGIGDGIYILTDTRLLRFARGQTAPALDLTLPAPAGAWSLHAAEGDAALLLDSGSAGETALYWLPPALRGKADLMTAAARYLPRDDRSYRLLPATDDTQPPGLIRVARDLTSWDCALKPGREPDCAVRVGPPLPLTPGEIDAYDKQTRIVLTRTALIGLTDELRLARSYPGPRISAAGQLLRSGQALMYWEGPGQALWRLGTAGAELVHPQVAALREAGNDIAVAAADGEVRALRNGLLRKPDDISARLGQAIVHSRFTSAGDVYRLKNGRAATASGTLLSDERLIFAADAAGVLPVLRQDGDDVDGWLEVQADGALAYSTIGTCYRDAPAPDPLPADFIGPPEDPLPLPPVAYDCQVTLISPARLDAGEVPMEVRRTSMDRITLQTSRRDIVLALDSLELISAQAAPPLSTSPDLRQARPQAPFVTIDGVSYLNAPQLTGTYFYGGRTPALLRPLEQQPAQPFTAPGLSWDRDSHRVRFATATGSETLPPEEALVNGHFLSHQPGRALRIAGGDIAWMTESGLWRQSGGVLSLVLRQAQPLPTGIDDGQFLAATTRTDPVTGASQLPGFTRRLAFGDLAIAVDPRAASVEAQLKVDGAPVSDVAGQGFVHDQRLGVVQTQGKAYYLTPLGLVPVDSLQGALSVPAGIQRLAAEDGRIYAAYPAGWQSLDPAQAGWTASTAPFLNADLARENNRTWERKDGVIRISSPDPWRIARQGLTFDQDRLLGFAASPSQAVAYTGAGSHAVTDMSGLQQPPAPAAGMVPALPLKARRVQDDRFVIYSRDGLVHDARSGWRPAAAGEDVWVRRQAASAAGISVSFDGGPKLTIDVTGIGTAVTAAAPFSWRAGQAMPFDTVTWLHADESETDLLIGTAFGLRHLRAGAGTSYANGGLYVPLRGGQPVPARVTWLGRKDAAPDKIHAAFDGSDCAVTDRIGAALQPCAAFAPADRFVAETDLWHISKSASAVRIAYIIDGAEQPLAMPLSGHLPHDTLRDYLTCGTRRVEHWYDRNVVRLAGKQYELAGLTDLWCQKTASRLTGGQTLAAGLYALSGPQTLRFDGTAFAPVMPAEAAGLARWQSGRTVLEAGRLRYGLAGQQTDTDYYALAGTWSTSPWSAGKLVIDQPRAIAWRGGLQTVTAEGVVHTPRGIVDPASLVVMSGTAPGDMAQCMAGRAETRDGRSHGLAAAPGGPVRLYCQDGTWLEGVTDGTSDTGTFAAVAAAPSVRLLIEDTGFLTAEAAYDAAGLPQAVSFTFRGEPARLGAGRFDFDTITQTAQAHPGQVDLLTDSGWWRTTPEVTLAGTARPPLATDHRRVAALTSDQSRRSAETGLCIAFKDGKSQIWLGGAAVESVSACRDLRGRDALWTWWDQGGVPLATGTSLNGVALERHLEKGRFADLVLTAAPLRRADGSLLVPGAMGVLVLDPVTSRASGIYALGTRGTMTRSSDGGAVWLESGAAWLLEGEGRQIDAQALACPALAALTSGLPDGYSLLRAVPGEAGWSGVRLMAAGTPVEALVDCQGPGLPYLWANRHHVGTHTRSASLGADGFDQLQLDLSGDRLVLSNGRIEATGETPVTAGRLRGLAAPQNGTGTFLIDESRLYHFAVAPAISRLAAEGRPVAQPADPTPQPAPGPAPEANPDAAAGKPPSAVPAPDNGPRTEEAPPTSGQATAASDGPASPAAPAAAAPGATGRAKEAAARARQGQDAGSADPGPAAGAVAPASARSARDEPSYDRAGIQRALSRVLGRRIGADGIIGQRSRTAIADWQRLIGSEPTGYLSARQVELLMGEL